MLSVRGVHGNGEHRRKQNLTPTLQLLRARTEPNQCNPEPLAKRPTRVPIRSPEPIPTHNPYQHPSCHNGSNPTSKALHSPNTIRSQSIANGPQYRGANLKPRWQNASPPRMDLYQPRFQKPPMDCRIQKAI